MTKAWLEIVAKSALCSIETLEATYDICQSVLRFDRGVAGDFAECGVYAGAHPAVMARALIDASHTDRRVHLFDSFAGIPLAGPQDEEFLAFGIKAGESTCSAQSVAANLQAWGLPAHLFVWHAGLFENTVPQHGISSLAVLRLDGDLYRSTAVCLDHLMPIVSRGGWVIVDDFNLAGCRKATLERIIPAPIYWRNPTK